MRVASSRIAIEALGQSLLPVSSDPDLIFEQSLVFFFRLLGCEFARRQGLELASVRGYPGLFSPDGLDGRNSLLERAPLDAEALSLAQGCVSSLVLDSGSPHAIISDAYEKLLRFQPRLTETGIFRLLDSRHPRKSCGSFYTPRSVAHIVVEETLRISGSFSGRRAETIKVLDPAMGTGVFLLEAIRYLAPDRVAQAKVAEECIHGVDSDPLAVELAILSLWLEIGARPAMMTRNLRQADFLRDRPPAEASYDAVVGNPPWGRHFDTAERIQLSERFSSLGGAFDSFKLFLDLATRLTRGAVGTIVPQAVLAQDSHRDIRRRLLERLAPYTVILLDDSCFPDAAAPSCALIFGAKPGPRVIRFAGVERNAGQLSRLRAGRQHPGGVPGGPYRTAQLQLKPL